MRLLTRIGRRIAARVARVVEQDELFEKPGERPRAVPLPPVPSPLPAAPAPPSATGADGGRCRPVGLPELQRALGAGGGLRLVNHWATWCEPCIEELPALRGLAAALPASATLLGVSWDLFESGGGASKVAADVASFCARHDMVWPSLLVVADPDAFFQALDLGAQKIPQTWLVSNDGQVVWRWEGLLDDAAVAAVVEQVELLGGQPA